MKLGGVPSGCRRAVDGIDEVVAAHLLESTIVEAIIADEDRLHRGLHVVIDAASAAALNRANYNIAASFLGIRPS
jgi:phage I-like protein